MKEKSPYEAFFDNTQDIQCINISIIAYDENGNRISQKRFDKTWKEKNIYNQAIVKKFVSGDFFH